MTLLQALGKAVRRLRIRRGLTQHQLAVRSEVNVSTIRSLENDFRGYAPSLSTLERVSETFEMRPSELYAFAEEVQTAKPLRQVAS